MHFQWRRLSGRSRSGVSTPSVHPDRGRNKSLLPASGEIAGVLHVFVQLLIIFAVDRVDILAEMFEFIFREGEEKIAELYMVGVALSTKGDKTVCCPLQYFFHKLIFVCCKGRTNEAMGQYLQIVNILFVNTYILLFANYIIL